MRSKKGKTVGTAEAAHHCQSLEFHSVVHRSAFN